jgi:DNA repair exonuclease SbcCD ATPase subunit
LTKTHLQEERTARKKEVTQAENAAKAAADARKAAKKEEQKAQEQLGELQNKVQKAREEFRDLNNLVNEAGREVKRLQQECGQIWSEMGEPYRRRTADKPPVDWSETVYPREADLAELQEQAGKLTTLHASSKDAETNLGEWNGLKGRESGADQDLQLLKKELPADHAKIRSDHVRLVAEEKSLSDGLTAKRRELETARQEVERLTAERGEIDKEIVAINAEVESEEKLRGQCRQSLSRALQQLSEDWRSAAERAGIGDLFRWQSERDALVEQQTDERAKQLAEAQANRTVLRKHLVELESSEKELPPEARQNPDDIIAQIRSAQTAETERDSKRTEAMLKEAELVQRGKQREKLQLDCLEAQAELKHAQLLTKLLSREYLQLHLIRTAERHVVYHANAILDSLSGGQLSLRLVGDADGEGTGEKALQLEAVNRDVGDRPINVAFLSGSQKFRVAVSLALGLGKYASKGHRPIESIIIDEGFGSLDREGRQSMIQELHNLRGQLKCILLVSHQEEFADAFTDGYKFELTNGATRVSRIPR